ncbi:hypothetical protein LOK49_Contig314G00001 [Camellia lanceoleosa]|nr:hypothetical protein LOK49_Contig314G00001 [Camellia lanceoleosa]
MKKLRWAMDGGFWELDVSTPVTLEGVGRAVPGQALPLGMCSRGSRLSRPKQIHFFQRFMSIPFLPSFSPPHSLSLQRVLTFPLPPPAAEYWFATLLGQFNLHKFLSSVKENGLIHLCNKSLYALNFCSELLITPDDTLLLGIEAYGDNKTTRKKALLHHKFLHHNLTAEASWPQLFVDDLGSYWDVPFSMAIDLASVASDSGASYHFCINHNAGQPKQHEDQLTSGKNVDIWRSKAPKLKMVQPLDIFLSNPHISASGILGAVLTACIGDNLVRSQGGEDSLPFKGLTLRAPVVNSTILADMFASISLSVQHGNFQRLFLDLTRFYARMDFPSGSKFISGATHLAQDLYNSCQPSVEAIQAICPKATLSLQQQIAGPFSFRVDSGLVLDYKNSGWHVSVNDPVFAIEYALQVLGSAKAVAWYSPKQQEFMIELRFFET